MRKTFKRLAPVIIGAIVALGLALTISSINQRHQDEIRAKNQRIQTELQQKQELDDSLQDTKTQLEQKAQEAQQKEQKLQQNDQKLQQKDKEIQNLNSQLQAKRDNQIKLASAKLPTKPASQAKPANPAASFINGGTVWDRLAQCESGGNWAINTGNGYYGGLQYDHGTWGGFGGYAEANQAPREVQIQKSEQVRAGRGFKPWPACSKSLGLL